MGCPCCRIPDAGGVPPAPPQSLHARTSAGIPAGGSPPEDTGPVSWTVLLLLQRRLRGPHPPRRQPSAEAPTGNGSGVFRRGVRDQGGWPKAAARRLLGVRGRSPCVCEPINRASDQSEQRIEPPHHP